MTPKRFRTWLFYNIYICINIHIHIWSAYHRLTSENPKFLPCPHSSSVADAPWKIQWMQQVGFQKTSTAVRSIRNPIEKTARMVVLLMEEIPNNHLGWNKTLVNNGINYLSSGAGFVPSTVSLEVLKSKPWILSSTRNDHLELPRLASNRLTSSSGGWFCVLFFFLSQNV